MTRQVPRQIPLITGRNIATARVQKGMTQRDVAEAIAERVPDALISPADISRWERAKVEPGGKYRHALAAVLFDGDLSAMYAEEAAAA